MKSIFSNNSKKAFLALICPLLLNACATTGNILNPFYDAPTEVALMGEKNDYAISGRNKKIDKARTALEQVGYYQRAHDPEPVKPVMNPAVVRLMWVPDHLNKNGDLVPAHFYYLKVRDDWWGVTDAFEIEQQLNSSTGGSTSNIPYIQAEDKY